MVGLLTGLHRPLLGIGTSRKDVRATGVVGRAVERIAPGAGLLCLAPWLTVALLLPAAAGILLGRPWSRPLSFVYAAASLAGCVAYGLALAYAVWGDEQALREAMAGEGLGETVVLEAVWLEVPAITLGAAYSLVVLGLMSGPSAPAASGGETPGTAAGRGQ